MSVKLRMKPSSEVQEKDLRLTEFHQIYLGHEKYVRRLLFWMGPAEAVDDLVQEVFVRVWKNLQKFEHRSQLKTWIYRIAMNALKDEYRRNKKRVFRKFEDKKQNSHCPIDDLETQDLIKRAIAELAFKERQVFVLFYQEELSMEDVAETLKLPLGTVKSRLFRAREDFRVYLKNYGVLL